MPSNQRLVYAAVNVETGLIKIGISCFPAKRAKELSALVGAQVTILGAVAGNFSDERLAHNTLCDSAEGGEWFRPSKQVVEFVQSLPEYKGEKSNVDLPGMVWRKRLMHTIEEKCAEYNLPIMSVAKETSFLHPMQKYLSENIIPTHYVVVQYHRALAKLCSGYKMPTHKEMGIF